MYLTLGLGWWLQTSGRWGLQIVVVRGAARTAQICTSGRQNNLSINEWHNQEEYIWVKLEQLPLNNVGVTYHPPTMQYWQLKGRNTLAQRLDVWSVWGGSEKVGNKYVRCSAATLFAPIQRAKSEEVGCRPSEPLDSLIGCVLYDHFDWRCLLANQHSVWEGWNFLFSCSAIRLLQQVQYIHATVELAARWSNVFNANFLPNGSDRRQQIGRIKAVCCWFESGQCVGALTTIHTRVLLALTTHVKTGWANNPQVALMTLRTHPHRVRKLATPFQSIRTEEGSLELKP